MQKTFVEHQQEIKKLQQLITRDLTEAKNDVKSSCLFLDILEVLNIPCYKETAEFEKNISAYDNFARFNLQSPVVNPLSGLAKLFCNRSLSIFNFTVVDMGHHKDGNFYFFVSKFLLILE